MYRNIVVGFDGSDEARDALALAGILRAPDGLATVICVYPDPGLPHGGEWRPLLEDEAGEMLDRAKANLGDAEWLRTAALPARSNGRGIQTYAEETEADLVVVGSSHRGRAGRLLAGTVGLKLLNGLACPIALAPKGYRERRHRLSAIGVGFDGSPESLEALHEAQRLGTEHGVVVEPFCVIPTPESWMGELSLGNQLDDDELEDYRRYELKRLLDHSSEVLPDELRARIRLLAGPPGPRLAHETSDLDLLVMGSRGYGPLRRVLLGSVSAVVVRAGTCPVLIIPRGVHRSGDRSATSVGNATD